MEKTMVNVEYLKNGVYHDKITIYESEKHNCMTSHSVNGNITDMINSVKQSKNTNDRRNKKREFLKLSNGMNDVIEAMNKLKTS